MQSQDIKTLRSKLGLSQRELAEKLGVSRNLIWYWESGKKKPGEDSLERLAKLANSVSNLDASVSKSVSKSEDMVSKMVSNSVSKSESVSKTVSKNDDAVSKSVSNSNQSVSKVSNFEHTVSNSVSKIIYDGIPTELKEYDHWVCWKTVERDGKPTKIPVGITGENASATNSSTWTSFEKAREYYENHDAIDGIGFVFSDDDPFCGIDLDKCRNAETGEIDTDAQKPIDDFASYTEASPSETGGHIIIEGKKKGAKARKGKIEIYDSGRYFTMTGNVLAGYTTIENRQEQLDKLYDTLFAKKERQSVSTQSQTVSFQRSKRNR